MSQQQKIYDLKERTTVFGIHIILFAKKIPYNEITKRLISQLVGAGTSIGANYCEADDAESPKDFIHKIAICKKEASETKYFLHMTVTAVPELAEEGRILWQEAKELHLILNKIYNNAKYKDKESNSTEVVTKNLE